MPMPECTGVCTTIVLVLITALTFVDARSIKAHAYGSNTTSRSVTLTVTDGTPSESDSPTATVSTSETGPSFTSESTASASESFTEATRSRTQPTASRSSSESPSESDSASRGGFRTPSLSVTAPSVSATVSIDVDTATTTHSDVISFSETVSGDAATVTPSLTFRPTPGPPRTPDAVNHAAATSGLAAGSIAAFAGAIAGVGPALSAAAARGVHTDTLLDRCRVGAPHEPVLLPFPTSLFPGYGLEDASSRAYYQRGAVAAAILVLIVAAFGAVVVVGVLAVSPPKDGNAGKGKRPFGERLAAATATARMPGAMAAFMALIAAVVAPSPLALALGASDGTSVAPNTDTFLAVGGFLIQLVALAMLAGIAKERATTLPSQPNGGRPLPPRLGYAQTILVPLTTVVGHQPFSRVAASDPVEDTRVKRLLLWGDRAWRAPFAAPDNVRASIELASRRTEVCAAFIRGPLMDPHGLPSLHATSPLDRAATFYPCIALFLVLVSGNVIGAAWHHPASESNCVTAAAVAFTVDLVGVAALAVLRPFAVQSLNGVAILVAALQLASSIAALVAVTSFDPESHGANLSEREAREHAAGFAIASMFVSWLMPAILIARMVLLHARKLAIRASPHETVTPPKTKTEKAQPLLTPASVDEHEMHIVPGSPATSPRAVSIHPAITERSISRARAVSFDPSATAGHDDHDDLPVIRPTWGDEHYELLNAHDDNDGGIDFVRHAGTPLASTGRRSPHRSGSDLQSAAVSAYVRDASDFMDDDQGDKPRALFRRSRGVTTPSPTFAEYRERDSASPTSRRARSDRIWDPLDTLL